MKNNNDLREAIYKSGIRQWQVAEKYGLSESNFSRLMRRELSTENKELIYHIINQLVYESKQESEEDNHGTANNVR
jgi:predicted XRE-type DNA-binding protein